jgi:Ni/Co efflux regulator RcnB
MKTSAIVCTVLAGSLGFSSLAFAQDGRRGDRDRGDRGDRVERQDRQERRAERRENRQERRVEQAYRQERQEDRAYRQGYRAGVQQPSYRYVQPAPAYRYSQPSYVYNQPRYYSGNSHRFYRGGYLPYEYRNHGYYVNNWNSYPHLYAPPHGHQWMNINGEFLLVALATGLIANAILN